MIRIRNTLRLGKNWWNKGRGRFWLRPFSIRNLCFVDCESVLDTRYWILDTGCSILDPASSCDYAATGYGLVQFFVDGVNTEEK